MAYTKKIWQSGETLTAVNMNHIEDGLEAVANAVDGIAPGLTEEAVQGLINTAVAPKLDSVVYEADKVTFALKSELPDVTGFATKAELDGYQPKGDYQPAGDYALAGNVYTKEEIDAKLVGAMSYKGSVETVADLPESANVGDMYDVKENGQNYAWNGEGWDGLGGSIDLSGLLTKDEAAKTYATKAEVPSTLEILTSSEFTSIVDQLETKEHATSTYQVKGDYQPAGDYAVFQKFSAGADPAERKTIQLANADSISGIDSKGTGYNLIMLSKWDKVDIGSTGVTMNLNSKDGIVQLNDEKVLATVDQIPSVKGFATMAEVEEKLAGYQVKGDYAPAGDYALKSEIPSVEDLATVTFVQEGFQPKGEYQPVGDYALKSEIPDVSGKLDTSVYEADKATFALKSEIPDVSGFAEKSTVETLASDVNNIGNVIIPEMNTNTAKALDTKVDWDAEKKVISLPMDGSISALRNAETLEGGVLVAQRSYDENVTFVTELGTTKNKLTLNASERPQIDIQGGDSQKVAYLSEIPSVEGLVSAEQLDTKLADYATTEVVEAEFASYDKIIKGEIEADYTSKEQFAEAGVHFLGSFSTSMQAEQKASEDGIYDNQAYSVLVYTVGEDQNGQIINNVQTGKTVQFLYWQGKRYTRTITNDGEKVVGSWASDDGYVALPRKGVMPNLFTLTTEADSDTVKKAMTATDTNEPITLDDLNKCLQTGYTLRFYAMQSGSVFVGFSGQAFTLTYIGFANPNQDPAIMSVAVNVTAEGQYSVVRNGTRGIALTNTSLPNDKTIVALDDRIEALEDVAVTTAELPIALKSFTNKVHEKAEILGWFGVEDEAGLKGIIASKRPIFVRYGISLSGQPRYYKFPAEYVAFESNTQVKLVFEGLDTSDDSVVRYTILMNLDGTLIGEQSNISMVLEPLGADVSNLATKEEVQAKAEAEHSHEIADVAGLQDALDGKQATGDYALKSELPSVEGLATTEALTSGLKAKADSEHTHELADVTDINKLVNPTFLTYSDPSETVQYLPKLEQSYVDELLKTSAEQGLVTINGQPWDAETNNWTIGAPYVVFCHFNESLTFEANLWSADSEHLGVVLNQVKSMIGTFYTEYQLKVKSIEERLTALEGK